MLGLFIVSAVYFVRAHVFIHVRRTALAAKPSYLGSERKIDDVLFVIYQ